MQKYFKLGMDSCPINPSFQRNKIFIDIPFFTEYLLWNTTFRVAQKAQTAPVKLKKADFKLNWQVYAATTGASQPSAFNFLRYALILRSLLNWL